MTDFEHGLGKGGLLAALEGRLSRARILPQVVLDYTTLGHSFEGWWQSAPSWVRSSCLIVRSNHRHEGMLAHAGRYRSILDVAPSSACVQSAAQSVFDSYAAPAPQDSLFVQPMIGSSHWSGVISSSDRETGAPYIVIEESAGTATDKVTGGKQGQISLTRWLNCCPEKGAPSPRHGMLVDALLEVASITGEKDLELEYAFDQGPLPVLLQVRRPGSYTSSSSDEAFRAHLDRIHDHAVRLFRSPTAESDSHVFSVMADWNPAEILGRKPGPLALSLYQTCFTDRIWTEARQAMGYADPGPWPLMHVVGGTAYIDVAQSFRSLLPASMSPVEVNAIVTAYLRELRARPEHHDSVELKVFPSTYTATSSQALALLESRGVPKPFLKKLNSGLKALTRDVFSGGGHLETDLAVLNEWVIRSLVLEPVCRPTISQFNERLSWLFHTGAPLFVRLARCAYMAVAQLDALVHSGKLDKTAYDAFFRSLRTVPSQLRALDKDGWREALGHLRPSSYDIESPCWRDRPDWMGVLNPGEPVDVPSFVLSDVHAESIQSWLDDLDWNLTAESLFQQCARAIEGRELGKFLFSRQLSPTLELMAGLCAEHGISRRQLSMLSLNQLTRAFANHLSPAAVAALTEAAVVSERLQGELHRVALPDVLMCPDQVYGHTQSSPPAHFMGSGVIEGRPLVFEKQMQQTLEGAIVALESADPGYDFLFHSRIAGLVTCYGGVNSHMAVRCKESGIPGVLGVGAETYRRLIKAEHIVIDLNTSRLTIAPVM